MEGGFGVDRGYTLDGRCEGGLGQQKDDGGGWATIRER